MEVVARHKLRVAFEPGADIGDRGIVSTEGGVAGLARGDLDALEDEGGFPTEHARELGGVELRGGGSQAGGEGIELGVGHQENYCVVGQR